MMNIFRFLLLASLVIFSLSVEAQIIHDAKSKTIQINSGDNRLILGVDYSSGCRISELKINSKNILAPEGVFTALKTIDTRWSSWDQPQQVTVTEKEKMLILEGIKLGNVLESWQFSIVDGNVFWTISRTYPNNLYLEDMAMPSWQFAKLNTWKGGILDNGGMVWTKYLSTVNDTYGVHTGGVTFWNEGQEDAFRVSVHTEQEQVVATKYTHGEQGNFACTHIVTDMELKQKYNLSRFVHGKEDVFAPFEMKKGIQRVTFELAYINYLESYDRGSLPGIDVDAVRELLNTTGRYGVVDNGIVGANGWITNWKCLHEPFFAQIGLALNDKNYTDNLSFTLDQERDLAMLDDGRVLSRWHDVTGDEIPGTYNLETGYYEAKWGYTVDSQTGYIINTAEQFQQTGDVEWLKKHKTSCERALAWLIRRDSNRNGIFEMVNNNISEEKASDWLDIVWAGFENAFVNAQMYEGLIQWAECERILGDFEKADYYLRIADRLKEAFNRSIEDGGFWSEEKKQYIYWRDKDGTVRGDNLVTPVNFAAIAFGICEDPERIQIILENIEQRTTEENLFHWPLCFDSFKREEVHANNWPFPRYENGDIFPTWGYLGVRSYVKFDRNLAVKYIRNILAQYRKDGLSSQRYSRKDQKGLGTDILAGISTTVTALYSDIYGVKPKWNRIGLEPNMVPELNGTSFSYTMRDTVYEVSLSVEDYRLRTSEFAVRSSGAFGVGKSGNNLIYYPDNKEITKLILNSQSSGFTDLQVKHWDADLYQWTVENNSKKTFTLQGLIPNTKYEKESNGVRENVLVLPDGSLTIETNNKAAVTFTLRRIK